MEPETTELVDTLAEAIALLRKYGVAHWANWLEKDKRLIGCSDFYGIEHLLSAFGGMGSFNDLTICRENGHSIEVKETESVNHRLMNLRNRMYGLAEAIHKEFNKK